MCVWEGDVRAGVAATREVDEATGTSNGYFVAVASEGDCDARHFETGAVCGSPGYFRASHDAAHGWESASGRLVVHRSLPERPLRDWAWQWSPAWGPLMLTIATEASQRDIERFLLEHAPMPYAPIRYV